MLITLAFRGQPRYQALWLAEKQHKLQSRSYLRLQSASRAYDLWLDLTSNAASFDWTLKNGRIRGLQYKHRQWASFVNLMTSILVLPTTSILFESLFC